MELVYLVTTACNYRCIHCNSNFWTPKMSELSAEKFIEVYEESELLQQCSIAITGGEPFLKNDLTELVKFLNERKVMCSITTNGRFTDRIEGLISQITNKDMLHFAVSIDGDEITHNRIRGGQQQEAYKHAFETVKLLTANQFPVQINMVIQKENYDILDTMGKEFEEMGAVLNYIPRVEYDDGTEDRFSEDETEKVYDYLKYNREKKLLLSEGRYRITNCHAGKTAWLLDSNGDVYTCFGCLTFKNVNDFLLGNVKEKKFDEMVLSSRTQKICDNLVKKCHGCAWPCEIVREVEQYGLSTEVTIDEVKIFYNKLSRQNHLNDFELDNANWHALEKDENGFYRWMNGRKASAFLRIDKAASYTLKIRCVNSSLDDIGSVRLYLNDLCVQEVRLNLGMNELEVPVNLALCEQIVKITIESDGQWCPKEKCMSADTRNLSLAVYSIEMC